MLAVDSLCGMQVEKIKQIDSLCGMALSVSTHVGLCDLFLNLEFISFLNLSSHKSRIVCATIA